MRFSDQCDCASRAGFIVFALPIALWGCPAFLSDDFRIAAYADAAGDGTDDTAPLQDADVPDVPSEDARSVDSDGSAHSGDASDDTKGTGGLDADAESGGDSAPQSGGDATGLDSGSIAVGLVAFYPFDETSGTTSADASGNGHTALMNSATFAAGLTGNAATMNGASQYVSLPIGIVAGLTSFSISAWVKLIAGPDGGSAGWSRVFDFGTGTGAYMFLTPSNGTTTTLQFATIDNAMVQELNHTAALATGSWQHVAITLIGTTGTLYVDGAPVAQNAAMTLNPASLGATTQNWLGRSQYAPNPYLNGQIDNFRIYSRALNATEVQSIFNQQL